MKKSEIQYAKGHIKQTKKALKLAVKEVVWLIGDLFIDHWNLFKTKIRRK